MGSVFVSSTPRGSHRVYCWLHPRLKSSLGPAGGFATRFHASGGECRNVCAVLGDQQAKSTGSAVYEQSKPCWVGSESLLAERCTRPRIISPVNVYRPRAHSLTTQHKVKVMPKQYNAHTQHRASASTSAARAPLPFHRSACDAEAVLPAMHRYSCRAPWAPGVREPFTSSCLASSRVTRRMALDSKASRAPCWWW
jgi:hypothetical protein